MQCLEECDEGSGLRRVQILAVSRHIAAALDNLTNQLILRKPHSNCVERRTALSALIAQRVAVVALLRLENQSALPFKRRTVVEKFRWNRYGAPRIHNRAPRRVSGEARKCSESNRYEQNREHGNGPAPPTFFTLAKQEW